MSIKLVINKKNRIKTGPLTQTQTPLSFCVDIDHFSTALILAYQDPRTYGTYLNISI